MNSQSVIQYSSKALHIRQRKLESPFAFEPAASAIENATARVILSEVPRRAAYESLIANIPGVVWSAALGGTTTFVSAKVEQVCAFTAAEILAAPGNIWIDRVHPEDFHRVQDAYNLFASTKTTFDAEYRWQRNDGAWIWLRSRAVIRFGTDPALVDGILIDITGQKLLEAQNRQLQKMEMVGQFAGGIAHDFNNLLTVILGNDNFLIDALPEGDPRRADAEAIFEAAERAALLTRQLLTFSRRQSFDTRVLNLNTLIEGVEKMLRRVLTEDIDFSMALTQGVGNVRADAGQIEQVIMNLVINARDAMPHGGQLSIKTAQVELGEQDVAPRAPHLPAVRGTYVMLTVSDTGSGMDAETTRRMFEPFFTTKENGKGTGLGLSTCSAIVKQIGGHLWADSEPGQGSVFTVYLPSVDLVAAATSKRVVTANLGGTETILVVEDDDRLRTLVHRVLDRLGYRVLGARDGQEALAVSRSHEGVLDLILSDVIVPDLSGVEIVNRVQGRFKDAKALFMSGHTNHALLDDGLLQNGTHFIQKPFMPEALAKKLREALDGSPTPPAMSECVQT